MSATTVISLSPLTVVSVAFYVAFIVMSFFADGLLLLWPYLLILSLDTYVLFPEPLGYLLADLYGLAMVVITCQLLYLLRPIQRMQPWVAGALFGWWIWIVPILATYTVLFLIGTFKAP